MAALTLANIETRCANSLRIPTTNSTEMTKLDAVINSVYRDIAMKYDWEFLDKRTVINTVDDITTGTISVTNDSTSATYSSAPTPSTAQRMLIVTGNTIDPGAAYRISAHTAAATALTLDAAYTGATNATAGYTVYGDSYDLPTDCEHVRYIRRAGFKDPVARIGPREMETIKGWDRSEGAPQMFSVYDFDTTGDPTTQRQLVIHPYPDAIYRMEIHYRQALNTEISGSTRAFLPDDFAQLLVWGALGVGYPIFLNDTERGTYFQTLFNDRLLLLTARKREMEGPPGIAPAPGYRVRSRLSPARVNLGTFFGRWPYDP